MVGKVSTVLGLVPHWGPDYRDPPPSEIQLTHLILLWFSLPLGTRFSAGVFPKACMNPSLTLWVQTSIYKQKKIQSTIKLNLMSWHGNSLCITGLLCGGSTSHWWIPLTKVSNAEIYVFFVLSLNKLLNKQLGCWLFETPWRSCYITVMIH